MRCMYTRTRRPRQTADDLAVTTRRPVDLLPTVLLQSNSGQVARPLRQTTTRTSKSEFMTLSYRIEVLEIGCRLL